MSKVGESIIQGAIEALEFSQSDYTGCEGIAPDTDPSEGKNAVSNTTERTED